MNYESDSILIASAGNHGSAASVLNQEFPFFVFLMIVVSTAMISSHSRVNSASLVDGRRSLLAISFSQYNVSLASFSAMPY